MARSAAGMALWGVWIRCRRSHFSLQRYAPLHVFLESAQAVKGVIGRGTGIPGRLEQYLGFRVRLFSGRLALHGSNHLPQEEKLMQPMRNEDAGRDAQVLLDKAIAVLDDANITIVAAQVDLARQTLAEFLCKPANVLARDCEGA